MARTADSIASDPSAKLGHVLLVEDEALLAAAIEQVLRDAGARSVTVCASARDALAALHRQSPDVLILDVNLADRNDGWSIAELAVELVTRNLRIVFSTATPERIPPDIAQFGVVLAKPYEPEELVRVLARMGSGNLLGRLREAIFPA